MLDVVIAGASISELPSVSSGGGGAGGGPPVPPPFMPPILFALKNAGPVTPNDGTDLVNQAVSLYVGGAGDLAVVMAGGQTVTFKAVPAGTFLNVLVNRVMATNTTATLIDAFW